MTETKPPPPALHSSRIQSELFDGTLNGYQKAATMTAIYPGQGTPLGLAYVALKGAGEAGEFAEHVGKAMRDDNLVELGVRGFDDRGTVEFHGLTKARREALIKEAGDQLWYIAAKCNELGITLEEVAHKNLDKLLDRQKRGTLSGSGDNR